MSLAKPLLLGETFENLRFWTKKVCQNVNTFEKMISKVKKTDEFLKVACQKCETLVTNFRKLKDALVKSPLLNEATWFGEGDWSVFWPT